MRKIKKYLFHIIIVVWLAALTILNILLLTNTKSLLDYQAKTKHIDTYQEWRLACLENGDKSSPECKRSEQIKGYPFEIKLHEN